MPTTTLPTPTDTDTTRDALIDAVNRQGTAVVGVLRRADPQAWLFLERSKYVQTGSCDPYAEQLLRRAGFIRG